MVQIGIIEKYVGKHGGCSNTFKIYVGVNWDNNLQIGEYMGCSDIRPATKKQRDLLFQKMKAADYEWDTEKKELKKIGHNPAWSEEDERTYKSVLYAFEHNYPLNSEQQKFIKSLKPQPKQEWGKEDEKCIRLTTDIIDSALRAGFCVQLDRDRCVDWLKSLKDRYTWKPSDAQMASITCAVRKMKESACYDSELVSLLNDLKKLRGE